MSGMWLAMVLAAAGSSGVQGKVAVLDFQPAGVDAKQAETMTRLFTAELGRAQGLEVLAREEMSVLLGNERRKLLLGCSESVCMMEVSALVDARWLVSGSVARLGDGWVANAQLLDASLGRVHSRAVERATNADALGQHMGALARSLLQQMASLHLYNQVAGATVFVDDKFVGKMPLEPIPLSLTGSHKVRAESVDHVPWSTDVELEPGRTSRVRVELERIDALESASRWRKVGGVLCAVGAVGGGVAGGLLFARAGAAYRQYDAMDPLNATQAQLDAAAADVSGRYVAAWATAGAAGVLAGAALWLVFFDPHAAKLGSAITVAPQVGPSGAGLVVAGGF